MLFVICCYFVFAVNVFPPISTYIMVYYDKINNTAYWCIVDRIVCAFNICICLYAFLINKVTLYLQHYHNSNRKKIQLLFLFEAFFLVDIFGRIDSKSISI